MPQDAPRKPKVSVEFVAPDGSTGQRSTMKDFETIQGRIFARIRKAVGDEVGNRLVIPGINAYNLSEYDKALSQFTEAVSKHPPLSEEVQPHIFICKRVVSTPLSLHDRTYSGAVDKWVTASALRRAFLKRPESRVRCKWCGHYTRYIDPDQGLAYLGTNNCQVCQRGYPVSDFVWDGLDGQAYIYYRHSVLEAAFYAEFEAQHDVHPDHTYFMAKRG